MTRPVIRPSDAALLWLESYMQAHPEGVWASDAHAAAKAAGHARRQIQIARSTLGLTVITLGRAGTIWRIDVAGEER